MALHIITQEAKHAIMAANAGWKFPGSEAGGLKHMTQSSQMWEQPQLCAVSVPRDSAAGQASRCLAREETTGVVALLGYAH